MFELILDKERFDRKIEMLYKLHGSSQNVPEIPVYYAPKSFPCLIKFIIAGHSATNMIRSHNYSNVAIYCMCCNRKMAKSLVYPYKKKLPEAFGEVSVWREDECEHIRVDTDALEHIFYKRTEFRFADGYVSWPSVFEMSIVNSKMPFIIFRAVLQRKEVPAVGLFVSVVGFDDARRLVYHKKNVAELWNKVNLDKKLLKMKEGEDEIPF